jgi:NAD(P)-dependent dehydrogenase (short-subunit alcohol dehydrogenase family)
MDLGGHIACVTGASSGLGPARGAGAQRCRRLRRGRRAPGLRRWPPCRGEAPGPVAAIPHDLTDRDGLADLAARATEPFGAPDILVHAAGINTREAADAVTPEGWDVTINLNLAVPFFLSQHMVPAMKEKGWGRIVNFASLQSHRAFPGGLSYGASKGGWRN